MSNDLPPGEKDRVSFAAIVLLLRQMAHQLLQDGRAEEARGLIDGIDAIRVKSKGNLDGEEEKFIGDVLYELQMMAVKGPAKSDDADDADDADGADGADDADGEAGDEDRPAPGAEAPG